MGRFRLLWLAAILVFNVDCSDGATPTKPAGTEGGQCYPNGTCDGRLICASGFCVILPDGAAPDHSAKLRDRGTVKDQQSTLRDGAGGDHRPALDTVNPAKLDLGQVALDHWPPPNPDKGSPKADVSPHKPDFLPWPDHTIAKDSKPPKSDTGVGCPDCKIGGVCVAEGAVNPGNNCQLCDISKSRYAWSPRPNGTACDDKVDCTFNDTCNGGTCAGKAYSCTWPAGGCASNMCTGKAVGSPPQGECDLQLVAINACLINGACYVKGDKHPDSGCVQCDPTQNKFAWTSSGWAGTLCSGAGSCSGGAYCYNPNPDPPPVPPLPSYCQCSCKPGMTPNPCGGGGTTCKPSPITGGYFCLK